MEIRGHLYDEIIKKNGEKQLIDQGHNMIVDKCHELVAKLIKGEIKYGESDPEFYFLVGSSDATPVPGDTGMHNESMREKVEEVSLTNYTITFSVTFGADKGNDTTDNKNQWKECGILARIGGNDFLLNRKVTNNVIIKDDTFAIKRTFKITF